MTHDGTRADGRDREDRAVSSVIAVILMVAITVIVAAVVGVYAMGFGSETRQDAPQIAWDQQTFFDDASGDLETLEVLHNGGAELDLERVEVTIDGTNASTVTGLLTEPSGPMRTGDRFTFDFGAAGTSYSAGDEIKIVLYGPEGQESTVLHTYELPRDTV